MAKIKSVSNYNGTSWDTPIPLGADDANIDITSATTDPTTDTTATAAGLIAADVVAGEGDTDATAWTKFNKFRRRVYNAFSGVAGVAVVNSVVSSGGNSKVYSAGYINNYMTNVIGHSGTTTPTDGTIMDQLNTTRQDLNNCVAKSGDTMTGKLINNVAFTNALMDFDRDVAPEIAKAYDSLEVIDKNSSLLSIHRVTHRTDGNIITSVGTRRYINSNSVFNSLNLGVTSAGERTVTVDDPAPWKAALGMPDGISLTSFLNSWAANGLNFIKRTGNVRHLHLSIRNGTTTSGTTVATFSGDKPTNTSLAPIFNLVGLSINGYLSIDTSGNVKINNVTTNTSVVSDLYWLV